MNKEDEAILEENDWIITCDDPLEIEHILTQDTATGLAVETIIAFHRLEKVVKK